MSQYENSKERLPPNVVCTCCGKEYHVKPSRLKQKRNCGFFCSRKCFNEYKRIWFVGENNHQFGLLGDKNPTFKGEEILSHNHNQIDILVYAPLHPHRDKKGRVKKHRLVVEENRQLFNSDYFELIDNIWVLKDGLVVHHKDGDHNNNSVENLEVLSRGQHTTHHNILNPMPRNSINGKFTKRL